MKAYALLGGPETEWPQNIRELFQKARANHDLVVGVDRGSLLLEEMQIIPDIAVGDFDSLKKEELSLIESNVADIRYSNPVKDLTDSELMLQIVLKDYQVERLIILGASGGRLDHFLVNLFMPLSRQIAQYAGKIELLDCQNLVKYYLPGHHLIKKISDYTYFGVGNLSSVKDLSITKAKYGLTKYYGNYPRMFSSNEFKQGSNSFELSFSQGLVLVVFSKDINRFYNI